MPVDIDALLRESGVEPKETLNWRRAPQWCGTYFQGGEFYPLSRVLWGVDGSAWRGWTVREVVPMRGNAPYFWNENFRSLKAKVAHWKMDAYAIPPSDELRRNIELLAHRNRYPAHSLAHIVVWTEGGGISEVTRYAIFQSKLQWDIFGPKPRGLWLASSPSGLRADNMRGQFPGVDDILEGYAERHAEVSGKDAAVISDSRGRLLRTTMGNLFVFKSNRIYGVAPESGGVEDPLSAQLQQIASRLSNIDVVLEDGLEQEFVFGCQDFGCFVCDSSVGIWPVQSVGSLAYRRNGEEKVAEPVFRTDTPARLASVAKDFFGV